MKKTGWYLGNQKPVRVGPYECEWMQDKLHLGGTYFNHWNGEDWQSGSASPTMCAKFPRTFSKEEQKRLIRWRGIKKGSK